MIRKREQHDNESITPWEQTEDSQQTCRSIAVNFSLQKKTTRFQNAANIAPHINKDNSLANMLAKKKHSILRRLNSKNVDQQKLIVRNNVQKTPTETELDFKAIYPSFSLKRIDKQPLNFKTEPSADSYLASKLNKSSADARKDIERQANLQFTLKQILRHKSQKQTSPNAHLKRVELIEKILCHSYEPNLSSSYRKQSSPTIFLEAPKNNDCHNDYLKEGTTDFWRSKQCAFIALPKIQLLQVKTPVS